MKDSTDLTVILDRSGSMASVADDTIGGYNTFLAEQQAAAGEATLSLVQFDHEYQVVYAGRPVAEVPPLTRQTFVPRGNTALLDAIGRTVVTTGERLAALPEADRPSRVVVVIITDGQENSSHDWTRQRVFEAISHQRDRYNWQFVFLGANQDAIGTAATMGIGGASSMTYAADGQGTQDAFASTSSKIRQYRGHPGGGAGGGGGGRVEFDAADRAKQSRKSRY